MFVPILVWTALVWLHNSGSLFVWPLEKIVPFDMATLIFVIYVGYYLLLDPIAAVRS
jgi:hypothetical protein